MNAIIQSTQTHRSNPYARAVLASKRARWDLEKDVLRGRVLDPTRPWLPDGLSLASQIPFLDDDGRRLFSQVQGRTYANIFGLVERFINAKVLELSQAHFLGDQVALEALVRFSDEELKHQELFRRIEALADEQLPHGYQTVSDPNDVARAVLGKSTWAVLALTLHIELFTQTHYKKSIEPSTRISELFQDVFRYHWMEESQHAVLDELEWEREDRRLSDGERDAAVDDFIELVSAVDGILQAQSAADAGYFADSAERDFSNAERNVLSQAFLKAYRYQYIISGVTETRFVQVLERLVNTEQLARIQAALAPIL
jgi:hypothetical protein